MKNLYKSGNKQNNDKNLDKIRALASRRKNGVIIKAKATDFIVRRLLLASTKLDLTSKREDQQNVSMKEIYIQTNDNKKPLATRT